MDKIKLQEQLINEADYDTAEVCEMTDRGLFDAWLREQGIVGFTDEIIDVIECLDFSDLYPILNN